MATNIFNYLPRMHQRELYTEDRQQLAKEISEAETVLAFYRTSKGENRVLTTGYCFNLFMLLIALLSRHIEVFRFFKKLIETIETIREGEDITKHVLEAVEYLNLNINQSKNNSYHEKQ